MTACLKSDLKIAVSELLGTVGFGLDWDVLPAEIPLSQALTLVDQACTLLTAAPNDDLDDEPVRLPPHRFPRDTWRASPRIRALIKLFFPENSDAFTWWQGEFR